MDNTLQRAMQWIIKIEGGYVNHPNDPGGETNYGISKRQYPDLDIRALTEDQATDIYRRDYWLANRCHEMPQALRIAVFDGAVNHRPKANAKMLQRSVGTTPDGLIGPATIRACQLEPQDLAINAYLWRRLQLYADLAGSSRYKPFLRGWISRLVRLRAELEQWYPTFFRPLTLEIEM